MSARFVFVTDSHHYPDAPRDFAAPKMLTKSQEILDAMVPAINAASPDFVVHGGDLLCGGGSFELTLEKYVRAIDEVGDALDGLRAPTYIVPGNHDCESGTGSFARFAERFDIPDTLDVFDVGPRLRLATVNIYQCDPLTEGQGIWTEELDRKLRAAATDASNDDCALVLALHSWILPLAGEEGSSTVITHAERLRETVATHPAIVIVLTGHRHRNRVALLHGCLLLDTACIVGYPMGFRDITLHEDGTIKIAFIVLGLPDLVQASYDRSSKAENERWDGEPGDRNAEIHSHRLQALWESGSRTNS
jgi:3',5'-cyclic AMP phosphodiesterase CpdA